MIKHNYCANVEPSFGWWHPADVGCITEFSKIVSIFEVKNWNCGKNIRDSELLRLILATRYSLIHFPNLEHRAPFRRFCDHTCHTVGLLWTNYQPVAETSPYTGQHNI
jgi:hypothetical protein